MEGDTETGEPGGLFLEYCTEGTLTEGARFARDLIAVNLVFRLILQKVGGAGNDHWKSHLSSVCLGALLLYWKLGFAFLWTAALVALSYFLLMIFTLVCKDIRGGVTSVFVLIFLLGLEYLVVEPKVWHSIRGVQMIAVMKVISVAMELQRGRAEEPPSPAAFAGYVMCPASCLLGPFTSFREYEKCLEIKYLDRRWFFIIIRDAVLALIALLLSNCIVPWYIGDESLWLRAYRDAQAFRTSHYFVSLMSQSGMVAAGFGDRDPNEGWRVRVTKPMTIEFPRSLVKVVSFWNVPMHRFLKTYVFEVCRPSGSFWAIFATYTVSSLLHGLNFQLSATLLSVGLFSYVEYRFRSKISQSFDACCGANPCPKTCGHRNKSDRIFVTMFNLSMSGLAIFHLAYLGVMFDASIEGQETGYSVGHTLNKWAELNFAGHAVAAITFIVYLLM